MPLIACGAPLMLQGFAIFWYPLHKQGLNLFERDFQPHNYSSSKKHLKNSILRLQPNTFASQAGELHALKEPRWRRPLASTVLWKAPPPDGRWTWRILAPSKNHVCKDKGQWCRYLCFFQLICVLFFWSCHSWIPTQTWPSCSLRGIVDPHYGGRQNPSGMRRQRHASGLIVDL